MKILISIIILAAFCAPAIILTERLLALATARAACTPLAASNRMQACAASAGRHSDPQVLRLAATTTASSQLRAGSNFT